MGFKSKSYKLETSTGHPSGSSGEERGRAGGFLRRVRERLFKVFKRNNNNKVKVFGVPLESLPQCDTEFGLVPRFVVDACSMLLEHADKEGLFRKTGSIAKRNALRVSLDAGEEECLSTADPYNVAGLLKAFFRELPEPILPTKLHGAFLKAQQLTSDVDRTAETLLLSCLLPDRNLSTLRYLFDFLHRVSLRSSVNKMDSSNLAVVLTPNLLPSGKGTESMDATDRLLKLQTAVIQCFIENSQDLGVLRPFSAKKTTSNRLPSFTLHTLSACCCGMW